MPKFEPDILNCKNTEISLQKTVQYHFDSEQQLPKTLRTQFWRLIFEAAISIKHGSLNNEIKKKGNINFVLTSRVPNKVGLF